MNTEREDIFDDYMGGLDQEQPLIYSLDAIPLPIYHSQEAYLKAQEQASQAIVEIVKQEMRDEELIDKHRKTIEIAKRIILHDGGKNTWEEGLEVVRAYLSLLGQLEGYE